MMDEHQLQEIQRAAESAVRFALRKTVVLDYSEPSVVLVDMCLGNLYEQKKRDNPSVQQIGNVATMFGAYLGEVMLRNGLADLGFQWDFAPDGQPALVRPGSEDMLRPLQRCFKRIVNGGESDVVSFYSWCFDAVYTEMGVEEGALSREYLAANGKIDAMWACRFFWDEWLFLPSDVIIWDGRGHHFIDEVKGNVDIFYTRPELIKGLAPMTRQAKELLDYLESDENLIVDDGAIHPALYRAIGEGSLTGITLFVLQTFPGAMKIEGEGDSYTVTYDERLAKSIPGFYDLCGTMIFDMRAFNDVSGRFEVAFKAENNEIDMIDPVDTIMENCVFEPDKVIEVM